MKKVNVRLSKANAKEVWLEVWSIPKSDFSDFATMISISEARRMAKKLGIKIY